MDPMAVPTYDLMMRPLLELAAQQDITWRAAEQAMRTHFHVKRRWLFLLRLGRLDSFATALAGR